MKWGCRGCCPYGAYTRLNCTKTPGNAVRTNTRGKEQRSEKASIVHDRAPKALTSTSSERNHMEHSTAKTRRRTGLPLPPCPAFLFSDLTSAVVPSQD